MSSRAEIHRGKRDALIVPVFTPPARIDATNAVAFAERVAEFLSRYRSMVIDCSQVEWITSSAMRALAAASHEGRIMLVHPSPSVHLMAVTHGVDVRLRAGSSLQSSETAAPTPGLVSVPIARVVSRDVHARSLR
jgi:anti-anti-sigma factor